MKAETGYITVRSAYPFLAGIIETGNGTADRASYAVTARTETTGDRLFMAGTQE